jgi:hypothetical protein
MGAIILLLLTLGAAAAQTTRPPGTSPVRVSSGVQTVFGRTGNVVATQGDYDFTKIAGSVTYGQLPAIAGGDVGGTPGALSVIKLRGREVAATAPTTGQALVWDGLQWTPQNQAGSGTNATQLQGRDMAATAPTDGQVLSWSTSNNRWQPGAGTGAAAVTSVFGRTGAITALFGDYSFAQISGAVAAGQLPAILGGDVGGALGSVSVVKIQGRAVATTAPSDGQALVWNAGASQWEPQNQTGTGTNATQLQGRDVAATAPASGQVLGWNGSAWGPATPTSNATQLQGRTVASTAPATGQMLGWDGSQWTPTSQAAAPIFVDGEVPAGTVNGTNAVFTLANTPIGGSVKLYRNGIRLSAGGYDYNISGGTITFTQSAIPQSGDRLLADYRR